jgi:hypothetical protein
MKRDKIMEMRREIKRKTRKNREYNQIKVATPRQTIRLRHKYSCTRTPKQYLPNEKSLKDCQER